MPRAICFEALLLSFFCIFSSLFGRDWLYMLNTLRSDPKIVRHATISYCIAILKVIGIKASSFLHIILLQRYREHSCIDTLRLYHFHVKTRNI